jgi:hypothetical protein
MSFKKKTPNVLNYILYKLERYDKKYGRKKTIAS